MPVLVKFSDNYADEFDVEGFAVFSSQTDFEVMLGNACASIDNELAQQRAKWIERNGQPQYSWQGQGEVEIYFGTNEFLTYSNSDQFRKAFEVSAITQDAYDTFAKHFKKYSGIQYGETRVFDYIVENGGMNE